MRLLTRAKFGVAAVFGISANDVYLLKSVRHRAWVVRALRPRPSLPIARLVHTHGAVGQADVVLCERLIAAYTAAAGTAATELSPIWAENLASKQGALTRLLVRADAQVLAQELSRMFASPIMYGIDAGDLYTGRNWRVYSLKILDDLVSLAEYLGVVRTESGQGTTAHAFDGGLDALVGNVEQALGAPLSFPSVGAAYGLRVRDVLLTLPTCEYQYVAHRFDDALRQHASHTPARLLEIGAGYGGTALFIARRLGDRLHRYTIIDLPEMNCLQGYFLGKVLGPEDIELFGESRPGARFRIGPPSALESAGKLDAVLNQNSLPEIPAVAARRYIEWMKRHVERFFFSYNHETLTAGREFAVTTVPDVVAQAGGLRRVSRELSWIRPGYVEEVYVPG